MSIASEILRLQQAKNDLAVSIANKGVTVPASATLDDYHTLVDNIQQGGGTLPYDAEIEYIESTGTQYIDTGITFAYGTDVIELSLNIAITSGTPRQLNGANGFLFFGVNASQKFEISGTAAGTYNSNFHNWYLHCMAGKRIIGTLDGTAYSGGTPAATNTNIYSIYLFALGGTNSAAASFFIKEKLKEAIIKKNGKVVRYYNPVRKNGIGYLYDNISKSLFGNDGTDNFILGNDIV